MGAIRRAMKVGIVLIEPDKPAVHPLHPSLRALLQNALPGPVMCDQLAEGHTLRRRVLGMTMIIIKTCAVGQRAVGTDLDIGAVWASRCGLLELRVVWVNGEMVDGEAAHITPRVFPSIVPAGGHGWWAELNELRGLCDQVLCALTLNINTVFGLDSDHEPIVPAFHPSWPALLARDGASKEKRVIPGAFRPGPLAVAGEDLPISKWRPMPDTMPVPTP